MKLQLGVLDVCYTDRNGTTTTWDVAEFLEADYHVMRTFETLNETQIAEQVADTFAGAIESIAQGRPPGFDVQGPMTHIEERFRDYIDRGDWEKLSGQRIAAAEAGVSHRKKKSHAKKNKKRTAFVDTGQYVASFRSWLED